MSVKAPRNPMPSQDASERKTNFNEVALGYDAETAVKEAKRCIQCKVPLCVQGCPVEVDIPEFINAISKENFSKAAKIVKSKNSLPAVCGRVCPQETQCEQKCILGIKGEPVAIGRLERFIADWEAKQGIDQPEKATPNNKKVAVIGAGPSGLTCAGDLAKLGYDVTIFEALHTPGGVLMYGIPEFRLPQEVVQREINYIKDLGVEIKVNNVLGRICTVDELMNEEGFASVYISTGAGLPSFMNIPGENLNGVYSANEFLTRTNLMSAYKFPDFDTPLKIGEKVAVIGAGNVAMDSARTALRLGAKEAMIVYRRSKKEIPARLEELEHAIEEGVQLHLLTAPTSINGNDCNEVVSMTCIKHELGEPDSSGRCRPIPLEGSEFEMEVDTVIMAIGQGPNPLVTKTTPGLDLTKRGNIVADEETGLTSKDGVFAGGDIVTGAATVILAMGAGKKAARAIHDYLENK